MPGLLILSPSTLVGSRFTAAVAVFGSLWVGLALGCGTVSRQQSCISQSRCLIALDLSSTQSPRRLAAPTAAVTGLLMGLVGGLPAALRGPWCWSCPWRLPEPVSTAALPVALLLAACLCTASCTSATHAAAAFAGTCPRRLVHRLPLHLLCDLHHPSVLPSSLGRAPGRPAG